MRTVSKTQAKKNREVAKIKRNLNKRCIVCGKYGTDAAHLLPKSTFPEHYINPLNIVIMCRDCHNLYDNDIQFRQKQTELYKRVLSFDECGAYRYFKL
jgi:ribosomal protein L44E